MTPSPPVQPDAHGGKRMLVVLFIVLAMSLIQVSSVNVALDSIGRSLDETSAQLQWVLSGYTLAIGVTLVPSGRIGDLFGRSRIFILGLIAFTLASAACAFAVDGTMLNALRLVQGAAAGIFSPQVTSIIQRYFSGQARAQAFALFGVVISASVAVGPVLAGALIDVLGPELGWRATFLINLPLGLLGILAAWRWLPLAQEKEEVRAGLEARAGTGRARRLPDLDPMGIALLVIAVVATMLPFMAQWTWRWWLLALACLGLVAWVAWEGHYARRGREPMVRLSLFSVRSFSFSTAIMFLQFMGATSVFVVIALFLQSGLHQSATATGLLGLPNAVASAAAAYVSGRYTLRYGRPIIAWSLVVILLGLGASVAVFRLIPSGVSFWWLALTLGVAGLGFGGIGSAAQTQAMVDLPPTAGGIAGGLTQTAQRIASAIGIAVITGILFTGLGAQGLESDLDTWVSAVVWAYLVILTVLACALVVAVIFLRDARPGRPHHAPATS